MKKTVLVFIVLLISTLISYSQDSQLKINNDEILLPFETSLAIKIDIEGEKLSNPKPLFYSKITNVIDFNTAFDNVYLDNLTEDAIAFKFSKVQCCGATTIALIAKSNIDFDFSFKYKIKGKDSTPDLVGESTSKGITSFNFQGTQYEKEITLYELKKLKN